MSSVEEEEQRKTPIPPDWLPSKTNGIVDQSAAHDGEEEWKEIEDKMLRYIERVTNEPKIEQELHLKHILEKNADTEYLQKYGLNGATDLESFRKKIPVSGYEAYRDSIERIVNGDTSPILSGDPAVEVLVSSGTTGGDPKIFPITAEDMELRGLAWGFVSPVLSRSIPSLQKGKFLNFAFVREGSRTPGGLPTKTAVTSFVHSQVYKNRPFHPIYRLTSPAEVFESADTDSAMYCHLLCGLLQRDEVVRIGAVYATVVVKALRALEKWWPDICNDISTGTLNPSFVRDEVLRAAVLPLLLGTDADLRKTIGAQIREDCFSKGGPFPHDGVIPRLWPNIQLIDTGGTGPSKAYLPTLASYSNNMRIICTPMYAATEGFFGLNMNPACPPEDTYYTLVPSVAYYEFVPVGGSLTHYKVHPTSVDETVLSAEKVFDLVSLEIGQQYAILVTTVSGYYRFRVDDIFQVVGFYNHTPLLQYVRRKHTLLSVDHDKTDEVELHTAVSKAVQVLESKMPGTRLLEYTSCTSQHHEIKSSEPGRYVIFWELSYSSTEKNVSVPSSVLERCCSVLEASLNFIYREGRYEDIIGPLELRLVQQGTFDLMFEHAVSRGATINQYKVPRGLNGPNQDAILQILNKRVIQKHFTESKPPFTTKTYKTRRCS